MLTFYLTLDLQFYNNNYMEFEIDVQHGIQGHVEVTDYSKEYGQYYPEEATGISATDKYKYSQSNTLNVIMRVNIDKVTLVDVLLDDHTNDKDQAIFDVDRDGYFTVQHFVLPTASWLAEQIASPNSLLPNYSTVYYIDNSKVYKRVNPLCLIQKKLALKNYLKEILKVLQF